MGLRVWMAIGTALMAIGFVMFFASAFAIARYGPVCIILVFLAMFMLCCGAFMMSRGWVAQPSIADPVVNVSEQDTVAPSGMEPEVMTGIGSGYCSNCGSPLSQGDTFCGACGKRL